MGSQVNPTTTWNLALVKESHHIGFQVNQATYRILVLVKGDRQIGS
jgi:hypothetical protein